MGSAFLCLYTNAEPWIRLKEPAIAGYAYNPPQTPTLKRRGLLLPYGQPCLRRRDIRDLRDLKDKRDAADAGVVG